MSSYKISGTDDPVLTREVDLPYNSRGWLVIDSMGYDRATGGVRIGNSVSKEEVRHLAREMTYKFSFLNFPLGGAKSGILCPSDLTPKERENLFFSFGKALRDLIGQGRYMPGTDMGTYEGDVRQIRAGAGIKTEDDPVLKMDSAFYTAVSVFSALKAMLSWRGLSPEGMRISIQGLGKVGLHVAELAFAHRMKVVAVSTRKGALYASDGMEEKELISCAQTYGEDIVLHCQNADRITHEELFSLDADILCPCAGIYSIHSGNAERIKARMIVPGCNVAADEKTEAKLFEKGIHYLPGFVCNSGGVLCYLLLGYGFDEAEMQSFIEEGIFRKVSCLFRIAEKEQISPVLAAHRIVERNQHRFLRESNSSASLNKLLVRFRHSGLKDIGRSMLWPFVRSSLHGSRSMKRNIARNILLKRHFFV
ncbi:MAG: Glu/Leu/Phe/Val dehydrogenase dimerization domain-containing protein [Desulfobacterales bacterium]